MTTTATQSQISYILDLAGKLEDRKFHSLYDARHLITGSHRNFSRGDAATTIDNLNARLAARTTEPTPAAEPVTVDGGMDAATAVSLLGKRVNLTACDGDTLLADVTSIVLSRGEPALRLSTPRGTTTTWRLVAIAEWTVVA